LLVGDSFDSFDLTLNGLGGYPKVGRGLLDAAVRVVTKVGKKGYDRFGIIKALDLLAGKFFVEHLLFFRGFYFSNMRSAPAPHKPPPATPPAAALPTRGEALKYAPSEHTSPPTPWG
jgi:hypothetical protein